jgi:hypothetical protein
MACPVSEAEACRLSAAEPKNTLSPVNVEEDDKEETDLSVSSRISTWTQTTRDGDVCEAIVDDCGRECFGQER